MSIFTAEKVLALPATFSPNTVYFVADANNANRLEVHIADNSGSVVRRVPTMADITAVINSAVSASNGVMVVANYAVLTAMDPTQSTKMVLVLDASTDTTVVSGAATYVNDGTSWVKIAEHESMDVTLEWASIQNGPTSTVAAIDAAVTASHDHANKTTLDSITAANVTLLNDLTDVSGKLQYKGSPVATQFNAVEW